MKVHVKFFAIFREHIGLKEDWREIEPGTTVEQLWRQYVAQAKNSRVGGIRATYAVNQQLASSNTPLQDGDEVAFLPPVSGGAEKKRRGRNFFITARKLNLNALIEKVTHPGVGAIVTFIGVVRDHARGKTVDHLEYEVYDELAVKALEQIGAEAQARWGDVRIAMAHRTGLLAVGEVSVMIAVSAPHRAEAFAACRHAIECIKTKLPIWKKEFAEDGEYWVEGTDVTEKDLTGF